MKWAVKRYWELCDTVEVEAESPERAIKAAHALPIPHGQAEFVPDSLNTDPSTEVQQLPAEAVMKVVIIDLYGDGESLRVCEDRPDIAELVDEYLQSETDDYFDEFMERKGVQLLIDRRISLADQAEERVSPEVERRSHGRSL